jgi:hypothetical protein
VACGAKEIGCTLRAGAIEAAIPHSLSHPLPSDLHAGPVQDVTRPAVIDAHHTILAKSIYLGRSKGSCHQPPFCIQVSPPRILEVDHLEAEAG